MEQDVESSIQDAEQINALRHEGASLHLQDEGNSSIVTELNLISASTSAAPPILSITCSSRDESDLPNHISTGKVPLPEDFNRTPIQRKPVNRKPLQRRALSGDTSENSSLYTSESLLTSPGLVPPNTAMLFKEASRSLTGLTRGVNGTDVQSSAENPPPYADPPNPTPARDEKRRYDEVDHARDEEPSDAMLMVRENRLDLLQSLIERGLPMNERDPNTGRTAIMEAANLHRVDAAQMLLRSECRIHSKDDNGWTALHYSSHQGDVEICQMLLNAGAQLNEYSAKGDTPLLLAAREGNSSVVQCLLNSWASQLSSDVVLVNGFLEAAKSGIVRTAELFVERGVSPKKIKDSWRPICYAASSGSIPMIDFLISHKCNVKQRDPEGQNALHYAARYGHTSMVEKLLSLNLYWGTHTYKSHETALHLATLGRHSSTAMALLLHKNARINMKDSDGMQPLHHCARNGDLLLMTTLLNKGANLSESNRYGWTPMLLVCAYGNALMVAEFITRGVSLEERLNSPSFKRDRTNEAARKGYWAEVRWPHVGAKPLHVALEFGHDEVANTLLAAGAKIEDSDSDGWRALHYAAFNGRARMVETLLNRGASPHATTAQGNTAFRLGFRETGLERYEERMQIREMLQAAEHANKKSKFRQLSSAMRAPFEKIQEVDERNKIWHTAQLAETLYQTSEPQDYYDIPNESQEKVTIHRKSLPANDNDSGYVESRTETGYENSLRFSRTLTFESHQSYYGT